MKNENFHLFRNSLIQIVHFIFKQLKFILLSQRHAPGALKLPPPRPLQKKNSNFALLTFNSVGCTKESIS